MEAAILTSLFGTLMTGVTQYNQANYNAKVAGQQGEALQQAQRLNEPLFREEADQLVGTQRATAAAMGLNPDFGSPLDMQIDAEKKYLRDKRRREYETQVGVSQTRSEASAQRAAGTGALTGSLFGGGGNAGLQYANFSLAKKGK